MSKNSPIAKFFMLGVIPFVFTVVLIVALLLFIGVDVGAGVAKIGQNLPLVGKYFVTAGDRPDSYQQKVTQLTDELNEHKQRIDELQQQLQAEQEKSAQLQAQSQEHISKEQAVAEQQWMDSYKQVAKSLTSMSASKAAPIISQMPPQEGLMMIYAMKDAQQSQVLSKLAPDQAAVYATMLKELLQLSNHMTFAQAAAEVVAKYEATFAEAAVNRQPAEWASVFSTMQPANAAAILAEMDENKALNILRELDVSARAAILSSLEANRASRLSQKLVADS